MGALIGVAAFLLIYGTPPLDVQNDAWIYQGFVEKDVTQHYAGWTNFRSSDWSFPLGKAENLMYSAGTIISFTDSIPLLSIGLKLISPILPETFQFFGWYTLLCFVLQGIAAMYLLSLFTDQKILLGLGAVLFAFSPIMIERAFRHTALASHWLILFSLYLYFKAQRQRFEKFPTAFVALNALAIGIHPYFLPMTMGITFAAALQGGIEKRRVGKPLGALALNVAAALLTGIVIGAIGSGIRADSWGFGYFAMNVNAPINPVSLDVPSWSIFLKRLPLVLGHYDGFNYLGVGVLSALFFCCGHFLLRGRGIKDLPSKFKPVVKAHGVLLLVLAILAVFALSNDVYLNETRILWYRLPSIVLKICSIFRASSRMFYPVYYIIFLAATVYLTRRSGRKMAAMLLAFFVALQIVDISPALAQKYAYFNNQAMTAETYDGEVWQFVADHYEFFYLCEENETYTNLFRELAIYTGKNGLKSNLPIANRSADDHTARLVEVRERLIAGELPSDLYAYVVLADEDLGWVTANLHPDLRVYDMGTVKLLLPVRPDMPAAPSVP